MSAFATGVDCAESSHQETIDDYHRNRARERELVWSADCSNHLTIVRFIDDFAE